MSPKQSKSTAGEAMQGVGELSALADALGKFERRALAQALSMIEGKDEVSGRKLLEQLLQKNQPHPCAVVGVTGSPGSGKSTLVDQLALQFAEHGMRVGVLAVDPSSSKSGGALLGDRVRMHAAQMHPSVFIRSIASRGDLGGLGPTVRDAIIVLRAAGVERIIVETVGVGQAEIAIAELADVVLLVEVPGMGDEVQALKAGVMEIADFICVNKADYPGADLALRHLRESMLGDSQVLGQRLQQVVKTVATSGQGVAELADLLNSFLAKR